MSLPGSVSSSTSARAALRALQHASCSSRRCFSSRASAVPSDLSVQVSMPFALPSVRVEFRLPRVLSQMSVGSSSDRYPDSESSAQELALAGPSSTPINALLARARDDASEASEDNVFGWDGMLNAVPKKKVSHSRKAMRSANKGLKNRVDLVHCPSCGSPKLAHHVCSSCYFEIARREKATGARWASSAPLRPSSPSKVGSAAAPTAAPGVRNFSSAQGRGPEEMDGKA